MYAYERARLSTLGLLLLLAGCQAEPRAIRIGQDACAHCRMTISDERYATELVTRTGKTYVFDSVECLAAFVKGETVPPDEVHSLWFSDFHHPNRLIPAEEALFVHAPSMRSPMGFNLAAFGKSITGATLVDSYGGSVIRWNEVLTLVQGGVAGPGRVVRRELPQRAEH